MAKPELGTKRVCPETGRKFYDLNRDPIVSPYTGQAYPLSFFEETGASEPAEEKDEPDEVVEAEAESSDVEVVSLEDADAEAKGGDDLPDIDDGDDEAVELDDDDSDSFLESDEDDDDDMSDIIGGVSDEDEES